MSERAALHQPSDVELNLTQIKLLHSIPRAVPSKPAAPAPAEAPFASAASTPSTAPPAAVFVGPIIATIGEFCLVLLLQLLFYFQVLLIPGAGRPEVAYALGGALLATTVAALLAVNSSWERTQWALAPLHCAAYALSCCWLVTYRGAAFLALGYFPLLALLLALGLSGLLRRFSLLAAAAALPALVANLVLLNVYVAEWFVVLPLTVFLAVQGLAQCWEARRGGTSRAEWLREGGRGFAVSVSLRFWWRRLRPQELLSLG